MAAHLQMPFTVESQTYKVCFSSKQIVSLPMCPVIIPKDFDHNWLCLVLQNTAFPGVGKIPMYVVSKVKYWELWECKGKSFYLFIFCVYNNHERWQCSCLLVLQESMVLALQGNHFQLAKWLPVIDMKSFSFFQ